MSFTLRASDLGSKFGFGDGDMLDDFLDEHGYDPTQRTDDQHLYFAHEVLARLVEYYLLPKLDPPVKVWRVGTIHNPIRAIDPSEVVHLTTAAEIDDVVILDVATIVADERGIVLGKDS